MIQLLNVGGQPYIILGEDDHVVLFDEKTGCAIDVRHKYDTFDDIIQGWEISKKLPPRAKLFTSEEGTVYDVQYELWAILPTGDDDRNALPDGELLFGE